MNFEHQPSEAELKRQARLKRFAPADETAADSTPSSEPKFGRNKMKDIFEQDKEDFGVSLDQLIQRDNRGEKNAYELKDKISKMKQRVDRFGDDTIKKAQERRIKKMEKKLEWTEHKAFPLPIQKQSNIIEDQLYLYGVDFMSTKDVEKYFDRYSRETGEQERNPKFQVKWINDSSCIIQLPSADMTTQAYNKLKLSQPREDDRLPPLDEYLKELQKFNEQETVKKAQNPDFDTLFGGEVEAEPELPQDNASVEIDPRNSENGIGFVDVMGYQLWLPDHDRHTDPWQNLWVRRGCDTDIKRKDTLGKNSRYYKFEIRKKHGPPKRDIWKPKQQGDFKKEKRGINLKDKLREVRGEKDQNREIRREASSDEDEQPIENPEAQGQGASQIDSNPQEEQQDYADELPQVDQNQIPEQSNDVQME